MMQMMKNRGVLGGLLQKKRERDEERGGRRGGYLSALLGRETELVKMDTGDGQRRVTKSSRGGRKKSKGRRGKRAEVMIMG